MATITSAAEEEEERSDGRKGATPSPSLSPSTTAPVNNTTLKVSASLGSCTSDAATPVSAAFRGLQLVKAKPRRLVSLCLGVLGQYFEEIVGDLSEISSIFPSHIKMALAAIGRRRKLLNDDVLMALVDNSWESLDISSSAVTDIGLARVARVCTNLHAADISHCDKITVAGVSDLLHHCHSLETLRCGGCPSSESTARRCLSIFKPKLKAVEEETWEALDCMDITSGAVSLCWLVWPKIDKDSLHSLSIECPRITVNPQPFPLSIRGLQVPRAALPGTVLDGPMVEDIDPKTWAVCGFFPQTNTPSDPNTTIPELPKAEKFRLAFEERDMRLAPKRAKNNRQHRRRADREWLSSNTAAKSIALASQANKYLRNHC